MYGVDTCVRSQDPQSMLAVESLFSFLGGNSETKACCFSKEAYCVIHFIHDVTPKVTEYRKKAPEK